MAKTKDVFGFDELEKAFGRMNKKDPDYSDSALMAYGQAIQKRTKALTPVYKGRSKEGIKPGQLRKSWRLLKPKLYKGGQVRVVRIQSAAPHSHLIEDGHRIFTTRRSRSSSGQYRKESIRSGRVSTKYNSIQRTVRGIKQGGNVPGVHMLENSFKEYKSRFENEAEKVMAKIIEEYERE